MAMTDRLERFLFEHADVRGEVVQLDDAFISILSRTDYSPAVQQLVGEGLAAVALLVATLKYPSALTLQLQSQGPLSLLLVQAGSDGALRAMARSRDELPDTGALADQAQQGTLAITIEPESGGERYQGVVDLTGQSLAAALEHYFRESEQLPTRVWLSAKANQAAGMLIQRLPGQSDVVDAHDEDAWQRAGVLASTLTGEELRELAPKEVIRRLFHEEDIRVFEPMPFEFRCRCSRARVASMLQGLGEPEMQETLAEQGEVEVHCDFCNEPYRFDAIDIERLFTDPASQPPASEQSH
ncbi:MAG: Hsp33 family molecular chaperone HslO [Spiribacter sp.]|jgi:molecular chaperone Hsp33|nr:Hsp33 family molecular chaperone HslO [Spiribacter sp.]MDR9489518.1 Hsp33 family molecular chaperone HslO [Spiribacter sp.]